MLVSNARLVQVAVAGLDDYDTPSVATVKWSGTVECYLEQRTVRVTVGDTSESQRVWKIYVPVDLGIDWAEDDLVTVSYKPRGYGPARGYTVPVQAIEVRDQPDMPEDVCTVALTVEPAAP